MLVQLTSAQRSPLRSQTSVLIQGGKVVESAILADADGQVFIEVPLRLQAKIKGLKSPNYTGELLAPIIREPINKAPRERMRNVVSFDFGSITGDHLQLTDRYYGLSQQRIKKLQSQDQDLKRYVMKVFVPVKTEQNIRTPKLYRYNNAKNTWQKIGGTLNQTQDNTTQLFQATITETGSYTLWDENPMPQFQNAINTDDITLAEPSPFPSVIPPEPPAQLLDPQTTTPQNSENFELSMPDTPQNSSKNIFDGIEVPAVIPFDQDVVLAPQNPPMPDNSAGIIAPGGLDFTSPTPETSINTTPQSAEEILPVTQNNSLDLLSIIPENQTIKANVSSEIDSDSFENSAPKLPQTGLIDWITAMFFGGITIFLLRKNLKLHWRALGSRSL